MPLRTTSRNRIGEYQCHTFVKELFRKQPIVLDLGGNVGDFAREMIDRYSATVYLYEPVEELFGQVPAGPQLKKFKEAVLATAGLTTIRTHPYRCASCFEQVQDGEIVTVQAVTLDTVLDRISDEEIDLVKIDIEGAEIDLLEGVRPERLRHVRQLSIEFHDFLYRGLTPRVEAIKKRFSAAGFYIIPFSMTNGDVLFVRKDILSLYDYLLYKYPIRFLRGAGRMLERLTDHQPSAVV